MQWLWENAEKLANLAQAVLAIAAIIALIVAYLQVKSVRRSQQEATAKEIYRDYLRAAFSNPTLASPTKKITKDYRYRWFAAIMLNACEEILATYGKDKVWRKVIFAEMKDHVFYLKSNYFVAPDEDSGWDLYSDELKRFFDEWFPDKKSVAP